MPKGDTFLSMGLFGTLLSLLAGDPPAPSKSAGENAGPHCPNPPLTNVVFTNLVTTKEPSYDTRT